MKDLTSGTVWTKGIKGGGERGIREDRRGGRCFQEFEGVLADKMLSIGYSIL